VLPFEARASAFFGVHFLAAVCQKRKMAKDLPAPRIRPWPLLAVREEAKYPVFSVERRTLVPPGQAPKDFFTLACADWTNVVAVTDEDQVVLVRQYRFGTDAFSLETPGGVIDPGETPAAAAARELLEETGYAAPRLEPLGCIDPNPAFQGNLCWSFVAWGAKLVGTQAFDAHEECEVVLVPRADLPALLDEGHIRHGLIVAAVERFLRKWP
jgi:ADP-ribose pyrophosphatase